MAGDKWLGKRQLSSNLGQETDKQVRDRWWRVLSVGFY
jgi:hypothetical protein